MSRTVKVWSAVIRAREQFVKEYGLLKFRSVALSYNNYDFIKTVDTSLTSYEQSLQSHIWGSVVMTRSPFIEDSFVAAMGVGGEVIKVEVMK